MRKVKYIILFLCMQVCDLPAQNKRAIDSLQNILATSDHDSVKIRTLIKLSFQHQGSDSEKALNFGKEALTLAEKTGDKKAEGNVLNVLGDVYWYKSEYAKSSEHYLKALKLFEQLDNKIAIADCYRNIGWIYYKQKNTAVALDHYNKSLAVNLRLNRKEQLAQNYNDIGIICTNTKDYEGAVENYMKSLKIQEDLGNKLGMSTSYGNLAIVYDYMGKTGLAIDNVERCVLIAKELGNNNHMAISYCNLGSFYANADRWEDALQALELSIGLAKEMNNMEIVKDCYQNIAELYQRKKEFEKAFEYGLMLTILKDSIYNENNSQQINEMTAKYDSEKKEMMISSLEKDNALSGERIQREQYLKIFLIIFCIMIAFFAFVLFRSNLNKKKANIQLSSAYKLIEIKNKDITDSINYSKRIQDASLPPKELKYKLFPDAFILFKPKDIVSGDFYWYTEKEGKRLIAACDCTGHGVPGALMSMIGNNLLNQIVNEKGIISPAEILNQLHAEIRKSLKQNDQAESRDGMDIALLVFNNDNEIEFAGAQRPLWIIRHLADVSVEEIKGDKLSLGGLQTEETRIFTNHTFSLAKGDRIYIFSDGFVDQFGGQHGKKFMTKNFKELLLNIYSDPMARQEMVIDQTLEKWKGPREQVDDVLVIGIKV